MVGIRKPDEGQLIWYGGGGRAMGADNNRKYRSGNKHEPVSQLTDRPGRSCHVNDDTLTYGKSKKKKIKNWY